MQELISIVVPMYFEEKVAEECYRRLTTVAAENDIRYEIIFVNDGSTDKTLDILERLARKDKHVRIISFSRNFGHQIAVSAGINKAKGDAVVVMDADLQDPPELIPAMIRLWESGFDVVYAKRRKREGETWFKLLTAKLFYRFLNRLSSVKIPFDTGDFRLIDRKVADVLRQMPESHRFVRGMVSWAGFRQAPIEYDRDERFAGETKYPFKKMVRLAFDAIFSFSSKPLKLVEYSGAFIVLLSFFTVAFLFSGLTPPGKTAGLTGWGPVLAAMLFLGGTQLLSIGLIGEYVVRTYDESRHRPMYVIDREINMEDQHGLIGEQYNLIEETMEHGENIRKIIG